MSDGVRFETVWLVLDNDYLLCNAIIAILSTQLQYRRGAIRDTLTISLNFKNIHTL
jgi:hypothetical protein